MENGQEDIQDVRPAIIADGELRALDPRWIRYRRQVGWAKSAVFTAVTVALTSGAVLLRDVSWIVAAAIATVLVVGVAWRAQWWPAVSYRYASYRLSARSLEIRRGVLWRSVIDVPRSRIQHSDVSQGPFERRHGLGTLSVHTAGTRYARVQLHGLDHDRALAIREHLMQADDDDVV